MRCVLKYLIRRRLPLDTATRFHPNKTNLGEACGAVYNGGSYRTTVETALSCSSRILFGEGETWFILALSYYKMQPPHDFAI